MAVNVERAGLPIEGNERIKTDTGHEVVTLSKDANCAAVVAKVKRHDVVNVISEVEPKQHFWLFRFTGWDGQECFRDIDF
jgi:hypothetical protein